MEKNPGLVFFGLFLIGMLFVPPSIPFMVPEAEAATYTISVDPTVGIGFSQSALTIAQGDSVTFTTTVPPPQWVSITDPAGGFHQFDTNSPVTWTFNQCGIIVFWDESSPAQFAPMTLTVECSDTTPPTITLPSDLASPYGNTNGIFVTTFGQPVATMNSDGTNATDGYSIETGTVFMRSVYTSSMMGISFTDDVAVDTPSHIWPSQGNLPDGLSCDNEITWNEHHPSWQGFPIGDTTITCTVSDTSGNTTTASFSVIVAFDGIPEGADTTPADTTPPTIFFRGGYAAGLDFEYGNLLIFGSTVNLTAADAVGVVFDGWYLYPFDPDLNTGGTAAGFDFEADYSCSVGTFEIPKSTASSDYGSSGYEPNFPGYNYYFKFPVGTSTVTCTVTDTAGNTTTASFTVTAVYEASAGPFTTNNMVIGVGAGEITCIGFENPPSGTQSVWLLGPAQEFADIGDGLTPGGLYRNIVENSQWLDDFTNISSTDLTCVYHSMAIAAGEYKFAASSLPQPNPANGQDGQAGFFDSIIGYSTPLILAEYTSPHCWTETWKSCPGTNPADTTPLVITVPNDITVIASNLNPVTEYCQHPCQTTMNWDGDLYGPVWDGFTGISWGDGDGGQCTVTEGTIGGMGYLNGPWLFPLGATTITCWAWTGGGFVPLGSDPNEGAASFTVTVLEAPADTSAFTTVVNYVETGNDVVCIGFENAPAGTATVQLLSNFGLPHPYMVDVDYLPPQFPSYVIQAVGITPGSCILNAGYHDAGAYWVIAYDSSGNELTHTQPFLTLDQWLTSEYPWYRTGPTLTYPDDITQTTTDPAGATVSFEIAFINVRC